MSTPVESQQGANVGKVVGDSRSIDLPSGRKVTIHLCKVRHIGRVSKILAGMVSVVSEVTGQQNLDIAGAIQDNTFLLRLLSQVADETYALVAMLSDIPYEQVLDLNLDDAVVLLAAILEDNYTFFTERVVPLVPKILPKQKAA